MKSLFSPQVNDEIIGRFKKLTPESKALWGKMNVNQMLLHCQRPIEVAFGRRQLKRGLIAVLFGNMIRKKLLNEVEFTRNSPTDKNFIIRETPDFEESRKILIGLIKEFNDRGPSAITTDPHPFFGKMTPTEWDILSFKHLDHHLRQFGV